MKTSASPCRRRSCPVHLRFVPRYLMTSKGRKIFQVPHAQIPEMHVPLHPQKGKAPSPHTDKPELLLQTSSDFSQQAEVECPRQSKNRDWPAVSYFRWKTTWRKSVTPQMALNFNLFSLFGYPLWGLCYDLLHSSPCPNALLQSKAE